MRDRDETEAQRGAVSSFTQMQGCIHPRSVSLQSWSSPHTKDVTPKDVTVLWVVWRVEGTGLRVPWNQQDVRLSLGDRPVVLVRKHSVPKHFLSTFCVPDTLLCSQDTTASQRGPRPLGAHRLKGETDLHSQADPPCLCDLGHMT